MDYSSDRIDWLRPPEVQGEAGNWISRWLLTSDCAPSEVAKLGERAQFDDDLIGLEVTPLEGNEFRLELTTVPHPLDPEAYVLVDSVFIWLHDLMAIVEINGAERSKWRTFRARAQHEQKEEPPFE